MIFSDEERARFNNKVDTAPGHGRDGDCHVWRLAPDSQGYGSFKCRGMRQGAHRASYLLSCGPVPVGMFVLHSCDNKMCVNPDHLRVGTTLDNMRDMSERGRSAHGTKHPAAKLTDRHVREIRRRYAAGEISQLALSEEFGVSQFLISKVVRREAWRHVK